MSLEIDIRKEFEGFKLDIRLRADNETVGFLGASGCGKSMTLKCIAGIVTPDDGIIIVDGVALFDSDKKINLPPQKRKTGYLFQNAALFPNMTAGDNIRCVIKNTKSKSEKMNQIRDILALVGLEGLEDRYPSQLSGGQQQRVALARILLSEPRIIMLDEPFSALDSYLRWQLEQELSSILGKFEGTAVFVSHNRDEVYRLCDKLAVIANGAVVTAGDKWSIFNDPQTYDACLLTGCKNISPARTADDQTVYADAWDMAFQLDKPSNSICYIGIRAHDIMLTDSPGINTFEYELVSTLRDTFSYILLLRKKYGTAEQLLRLEIGREKYEALLTLPKYVCLPADKLLLMHR